MNAPTLLPCDAAREYDAQIWKDFALENILSAGARKVLCRPCGRQAIQERQALFQALEDEVLREKMQALSDVLSDIAKIHAHFSQANRIEQAFLYRTILRLYCSTVDCIRNLTSSCELIVHFQKFWLDTVHENLYAQIREALPQIERLLDDIRLFDISVQDSVWIGKGSDAIPYTEEIRPILEAFGVQVKPKSSAGLSLERNLVDALCQIHGGALDELSALYSAFEDIDSVELAAYLPQIRFYFEILNLKQTAQKRGIKICYPSVADAKIYMAKDAYDISLLQQNTDIVPNNIRIDADNRFSFVTGANSGGKTTYLRCVGINLLLFLGGCPIFAESAEICAYPYIVTHFPKDERFSDVGRLEDERCRMETIFSTSPTDAFVLLNEPFGGANEAVGTDLLLDTANRMIEFSMMGLCVTHFYQVSRADFPILSVLVDEENDNRRTFKIGPADKKRSYTEDILRKYQLDAETLKRRMQK